MSTLFQTEKHQSILTYQNIGIHRPGLMSDLFFIQCPLGMGGSPGGGPGNTPIFSPGESHGQRSLVGYSPWGSRESDTNEAT